MKKRHCEMQMKRGRAIRPGHGLRRERGAMLALVAIAMIGLMGMLVLTIDAGYAHRQRRMAQTAADAGAQAGALEIFRQHRDSARTTAFGETSRNGFTDGANNVVVTVNNPPLGGSHIGDTLYVEVIVQQTLNTFFGRVVNRPTLSLQPRAVAGVVLPAQNCMVALDPHAALAFDVRAGANVTAENCNIAVNSDSDQALQVVCSGITDLTATPPGAISVTGDWTGCGSPFPPPVTGVTAATDPLAYLNSQVWDESCPGAYGLLTITSTVTLNPGVFCGGILIKKITAIVTFNPGLYVIKGGGFDVEAKATIKTLRGGTGSSFVNLNAPAVNGGASKFAPFFIGSDVVVGDTATVPGPPDPFSAMQTGPMAGVLFYTPLGVGVGVEHKFTSAATLTVNGSIYLPSGSLEVGGGAPSLTLNGGIVAGMLRFSSDGTIVVKGFSGGGGFYTLKRASLVE